MPKLILATLLFTGSFAFAYTGHRCESADEHKVFFLLFDGADNYFVFAKLSVDGGAPTPAVRQSASQWRPTPSSPNQPPLVLAFGQSTFTFSLDGKSAQLETGGATETLACCNDYGNNTPCAGRPQ